MSGPAVLRFKARLVRETGGGISLDLPAAIGKRVRGMLKVEGVINGQPFRAPLEEQTPSRCVLRVNKAMLNGSGARIGDTVNLAILGPEPKLTVPPDLRAALAGSSAARTLWSDLTEIGKRDYVRWVEGTKNPQTRAKRVRRSVEQLAEGKRRPCCVNVYEYMLTRIEDD